MGRLRGQSKSGCTKGAKRSGRARGLQSRKSTCRSSGGGCKRPSLSVNAHAFGSAIWRGGRTAKDLGSAEASGSQDGASEEDAVRACEARPLAGVTGNSALRADPCGTLRCRRGKGRPFSTALRAASAPAAAAAPRAVRPSSHGSSGRRCGIIGPFARLAGLQLGLLGPFARLTGLQLGLLGPLRGSVGCSSGSWALGAAHRAAAPALGAAAAALRAVRAAHGAVCLLHCVRSLFRFLFFAGDLEVSAFLLEIRCCPALSSGHGFAAG